MTKIAYWVVTIVIIILLLALITGCASRDDDYWGSVAVGVGNQINKDEQ